MPSYLGNFPNTQQFLKEAKSVLFFLFRKFLKCQAIWEYSKYKGSREFPIPRNLENSLNSWKSWKFLKFLEIWEIPQIPIFFKSIQLLLGENSKPKQVSVQVYLNSLTKETTNSETFY